MQILLLSLSDAELATLLLGPLAPESPVTPVAGPSLPADSTPTLHGVEVGTSPPPTATNPNVVNTIYHFDPNAPPPTATTLEFRDGQLQGPLVTTLQNPVQTPQMTPEEALNRLQNRPQIVVDSSTPPVVQATTPSVLLLNDPAIRIIQAGGILPGGNQWIYTQDPDGTLHPFMTTFQYADMIARGNAASSGATPGWTFGATFGEIGNVIAYLPSIDYTPIIVGSLQIAAAPFVPGLVIQGPVNSATNNVGSIYNDQRNTGENIAGSVFLTTVYSVVSVVGLVDLHESVTGREARSGNELTSNERWSRGLIGGGTFLLSLLPFAPSSRAAPAVAGESTEAAAARAALEADVRASLQAAQAERRAAALRRGERQAMVPERPAGPAGEGPVPRPEPVPPVEAPVPPPVEAPVPPRIETPTPAERPIPSEGPVPPVEAPVPPVATTPTPALPGGTGPAYNEATGQGIYVLRDATGEIRYVGRGDAPQRLLDHAAPGSGKEGLVGEILFDNNLSAAQAQSLEQELMQMLGGPVSTNSGTALLNRIQSVAESNPEFLWLEFAAHDGLVIEALRRAGLLGR